MLPPVELLDRAVKERVTKQRYVHSEGVRDTAVFLAGRYGCDEKKAACAAILHDVARDLPLLTMQRIAVTRCTGKTNRDIEERSQSASVRRIPGKNSREPVRDGENDPVPSLFNDVVFRSTGLLHAYAGKVIACRDFGISDEEVLHSIELHTTGGEGMSVLDKVVFVADYTEPTRSFRGVQTARRIAKRDLDEAVLYIFGSMLRMLVQKKSYICGNTLLGYNELIRCTEGRNP
ncbi:MAG: bis(5'-nucleosyl)-tetraphosphatase (symmetrical) YqeK [Spirochaetes bacterium]|nr:bis(5'-nucleosyl)-tetraphosphatase (symmetrical) YqeK [Spirochaetota bacterium]